MNRNVNPSSYYMFMLKLKCKQVDFCVCRSDQSVPRGGPRGISPARVGASLLSADGRHCGELASKRKVPAAHLLHLRLYLCLRRQGGRATQRQTHKFLLNNRSKLK